MVMEIREVKEAFFSHREEVCKAVRAGSFFRIRKTGGSGGLSA